ncbi:hypothetical protein ACLOJK_013939 [Asimina triloba]
MDTEAEGRRRREGEMEEQLESGGREQSERGGGGGVVLRSSNQRRVWPTIDGPLGLSEEDSVAHARSFFKYGFFLLPWLWAINCFYFWPVLRSDPHSFPRIRRCKHSFPSPFFISVYSLVQFMNGMILQCLGIAIVGKFDSSAEKGVASYGRITFHRDDVVGSAIGFTVFTALLASWALTFVIGGEQLFGPVWKDLVMYEVADRWGLTGWD